MLKPQDNSQHVQFCQKKLHNDNKLVISKTIKKLLINEFNNSDNKKKSVICSNNNDK